MASSPDERYRTCAHERDQRPPQPIAYPDTLYLKVWIEVAGTYDIRRGSCHTWKAGTDRDGAGGKGETQGGGGGATQVYTDGSTFAAYAYLHGRSSVEGCVQAIERLQYSC